MIVNIIIILIVIKSKNKSDKHNLKGLDLTRITPKYLISETQVIITPVTLVMIVQIYVTPITRV